MYNLKSKADVSSIYDCYKMYTSAHGFYFEDELKVT